jgi:hypothetical protein
MDSARARLAAALIVLAGCGSSTKKPSTEAGPEVGAAGHVGAAGGADASGAAGGGADAAAGGRSAVDAGGGAAGGDAAREALADAPPERADGAGAGTSADAGVEAPPRTPGSPYRALAVSTGRLHTCAILDDHRIKCWGRNPYGQLGLGDVRDRGASASDMGDNLPFVDLGTGRTAAAVSAGGYHTCAILDDGSVKCWGFEIVPDLPPSEFGQWGGAPGQMGDHLPALVFGGGGHKALLLGSGLTSSCAVLDDQSIWCWGAGARPMVVPLGAHADVVQLAPWQDGARALFADHTVSPKLPTDRVQAFQPANVVYIAGSEEGGCAVLGDGTATCGALSPTPFGSAGAPVTGLLAVGLDGFGSDMCGLFAGGAVRCWGACAEGPMGANVWCGPVQADGSKPALLGQPALALTTDGSPHICALLADGGVKCWTLDPGCSAATDGAPCEVPAQDAQNANLGSSIEVVTMNGVRHYGAWHEIDVGKHP